MAAQMDSTNVLGNGSPTALRGNLPPSAGISSAAAVAAEDSARSSPADRLQPTCVELVGDSSAVSSLRKHVSSMAGTRASVLLMGERGVGKELVARWLHGTSPRAERPFICLHCASLTSAQYEAELAALIDAGRASATESAALPGTLYFDELADLAPELQMRTLRLSAQLAEADIGLIGATRFDLQRLLDEGKVRADFLELVAMFPLVVPALRERPEDAEVLANEVLAGLNASEGVSRRFSADSLAYLRQHRWPGNVRELQSTVRQAFIVAADELDLRAAARHAALPFAVLDAQTLRIPVGTNLADAERWMIVATLRKCRGNKTRAAALLGVSLKTLYNRLHAYRAQGLSLDDMDAELTEVAS